MIDYPARLNAVRQRMMERNVGLMYLPPGANLFYLTGIQRQEQGGTDHNAYGDYVVGGYFGPRGGVTLLSPRMGGGYYGGEAEDNPWLEDVRLIHESESPGDALQEILRPFD